MYITEQRYHPLHTENRVFGHCVRTLISTGAFVSDTPLTAYGTSYGGIQTTTSWRTGDRLSRVKKRVIPGDEMYRLIRSGYDLDVQPGSSGVNYELRDKRSSAYDTGHEFSTLDSDDLLWPTNYLLLRKNVERYRSRNMKFTAYNDTGGYRDTVTFDGSSPYWKPATSNAYGSLTSFPSDSQRAMDGQECVVKCMPVRKVADTSTSLAELYREGFPVVGRALTERGSGDPSVLGSTYLEYVFGAKPLMGYAKSILKAVQKSSELLYQLHRNSGLPVRRTYGLYSRDYEEVISEGPLLSGAFSWKLNDGNFSMSNFRNLANAKYRFTDHHRQRCWFSGEFVYYLPDQTGILGDANRFLTDMNYLYGTGVDLDTLWKLTPWSWLCDWWTNIGNILAFGAAQSQFGLVMNYGYVMHHYSVERSCVITGLRTKQLEPLPAFVSHDTMYQKKTRMRANPFGFGVSTESLTASQWAILGALGLSNGPGLLRLNE